MNDPRSRQVGFNALSRGQWDGFSAHRRKVTGLLVDAARGTGRLCVLGAGNGNDIDLAPLLTAYREVHLVDLDAEALARGAERQGVEDHPSLRLHGGLDLTGMLDAIARWSPLVPIPDADLGALVEWPAARVGLALPGPFDLVASTCLLSQLVGNATEGMGESHPRLLRVVEAIRLGHLRLMARLAAPGGTILLITDVVSSTLLPLLDATTDEGLAALLTRLSRRSGLIRGVNPLDILAAFRGDPILSRSVTDLEPVLPWRWRLHARDYLVWALKGRCVPGSNRRG